MKRKTVYNVFILTMTLFILVIMPARIVSADNLSVHLESTGYAIKENSSYAVKNGTKTDIFVFGEKTLGTLSIDGEILETQPYNNVTAYTAVDELRFRYYYDGDYQNDNKNDWNLTDSDAKKISGCDTDGKIKCGGLLVQSSSDGENWDKEIVKTDVFSSNKSELTDFYTINEKEIRKGTYYRIVIVYEMKKKIGENKLGIDKYKNARFMEVYKCYVGYGADPISFKDINSGTESNEQAEFIDGFILDKGGSNFDVSVSKDGDTSKKVSNYTAFTKKGTYDFTITSELGKQYTRTIVVSNGLKSVNISPKVFEGGKKGNYDESVYPNSGIASYGKESLSALKLAQNGDNEIVDSTIGNIDSYGVNGNKIGLYLDVETSPSGYEIYDDDYGKKKKQTVNEAWVGEIRRGALLVQKSNNGTDWKRIDSKHYTDGLYTTDYGKYYAGKGERLIYTPEGTDILKGVYLKVTYAYNILNKTTKEENRCIEVYTIFICSNDLDAVTFHNMTVQDDVDNYIDDSDGLSAEIHKSAESLQSGSSTITGFRIDKSGNPTVRYTVSCNDKSIEIPESNEFTTSGRYVIELTSAVGTTKKVTLYVDRNSSKKAIQAYFGDSFITGKRIFSDGEIPTFEGGLADYNVLPSDKNLRSVSGTITNLSTHNEIHIDQNSSAQSDTLVEAGIYEAVFTTRPEDSMFPGDYWKFTFNFKIIEEGTAPGPVVNKNSLEEYLYKNVSDLYPMYYGVTDKSENHDVTVAFSTYENALKFAYALEVQDAEPQEDGSYRYKSTEQDTQKILYPDLASVTAAEYYFAEKRVEELYFDLSDQFTYVTLKDKEIENTEDLRDLDLNSSVIIAGEGEKQKSSNINAYKYPLISPKPYAYLSLKGGTIDKGYNDFKLVKDRNGYDSNNFTITDESGKVYDIGYGDKVGEKLEQQGCPSGIITITEETCYGDTTSYNAIFIAKDDNTAKITLSCTTDGKEADLSFTQDNNGQVIETDCFRLSQITDLLDPCTLVKISYKKGEALENEFFIADRISDKVWSMKGEYTISVINRLGYSYSLTANVSGNAEIVLDFQGEGVNISTAYGAKNVKLPPLTKTGYDLVGFEDENGNIYSDEISEILFKGNTVLKAVWEAKEYKLTYIDANGKKISDSKVKFGETIDLSKPKVRRGMEFVGWLNNGKLIEGDTLNVDSDNDIVLTASVRPISMSKKIRNVSIGGSFALLILVIIIKKVKGGKRHEKA